MKLATKSLLLPFTLTAMFAVGQTIPQGTFKHIIFVFQENRTPDNLFGSNPAFSGCGRSDPFEPGVDIQDGGYNNTTNQLTCNMQLPLNGWDADLDQAAIPIGIISPDHSYDPTYPTPTGWVADYDYDPNTQTGKMDGFCHEYGNPQWPHPCPSYSYVAAGDVQPYFFIATNYGFANYMFQSNEGASFTAHQFLFTGTSAPVAPNYTSNNYNLDFVAEYTSAGCEHSGAGPDWVLPDGSEIGDPLNSTCYAHDSLVTAAVDCNANTHHCDRGTSWGYYGPSSYSQWNAPQVNPQTCYGQPNRPSQPPYACPITLGTEYGDHVHLPGRPIPWNPTATYSDAPIFDDLYGCQLPAISWVVPDGRWSDHTFSGNTSNSLALGPYWVGDIINAVGNGVGKACNGKYWTTEPTAVIVTWDDWGGWYDHVAPWAYYRGTRSGNGWTCTAPNGWGCGYVSGFRVPLLVVSAWTGTPTQSGVTGYVSGPCGQGMHNCPNFGLNNIYVHDFGSILAFTEWNFSFNPQFIAQPDYADYNAPDWGGTPGGAQVPLLDFFQLPLNQPRQFVSVPTGQWTYNCFTAWGSCGGTQGPYLAEDPDDY